MDLIEPCILKDKCNTILDSMCLTIFDPTIGWFEIIELPSSSVEVKYKGEETSEVIMDES